MNDILKLSEEIDLWRLRHFLAVAEELHFGRAARRLGIAQPPLSQQVQKLERSLGVALFVRDRKSVLLTDAGRSLQGSVQRLLGDAVRGVEAARRASRGEIGELRVGFSASAALSVLPEIVKRYRSKHPDVKLILEERTTSAQIAALEAGRLELGILRGPLEHESLESRTLARERLVAILPSDHALARSKSVDPRVLAREPFILFPRHVAPSFHDVLVRACGTPPTVAVEAAEWSTIVSLVAGGNGVSLGPESVRRLRWPQVAYSPVSTRARAELLLCRRRAPASELVRGFLDACARER